MIKSVDTPLIKLRETLGDGLMYTHIEESRDTLISVITAGGDVPEDRLTEIKLRYNDIMSREKPVITSATELLSGLDDPFAATKKLDKNGSEDDFSGLDL